MTSTLDKLKALNDKLEVKIAQREEGAGSASATKKRSRKSSQNDDETAVKISYEDMAKTLISHMKIDSEREPVRAENLKRVSQLYVELEINIKAPIIEELFVYKAMNISGISLKEEDFGDIRAGKYVQVIAITYEPDKNGKKKAKNISLGYFGKAETLDDDYKNDVIEFVLRWRYEKAFQNLEHYRDLINNIRPEK